MYHVDSPINLKEFGLLAICYLVSVSLSLVHKPLLPRMLVTTADARYSLIFNMLPP